MYHHHHSQQQGPQPFSNGPRPPHHPPAPNQHQNSSPSNMLMGFQFPRPTQLPDELESALAIRGARDMDHRLVDHMNRPNQHQSQGSGSGISQHGNYSSNPDNQPGHQQGVDWSSYQPPTKLFAGPPPNASHQSQQHQGLQQQPQSSHAGTSISSWTVPVNDSPSPQARQPHGGGSGVGGDNQALYTPESAGSILASFGLSNEDLEVLSHYPDDQLTPDTLPFILRDIQINKSGNQNPVASTSSSSFSRSMQLPPSSSSPSARSRSPEVPSLLTVTQTAGKVIDYGHASRAKEENTTRETFKRERLSGERTVKMYPSSSSSVPKLDKAERRQVRLEHSTSSKHGDRDYRRTSSDHHKSSRSPGREFPPSSKSRNLDRDYRRDGPKPRPPSETKSEESSRRSLSSSSGSKPHSSSKKLPTPIMISDFSAVSPMVYPHTCSLCHTQCDQEKDWVDHINTVNHTAACRDLRNKYPGWKPNLPSRSGRYGSRALWDPRNHSPSHSVSRSLSGSLSPSPPHSKHRPGPHPHRPYSPHYQPRYPHYTGGSSRGGLKRPHDDSTRFSTGTSRHPFSPKAGHSTKHGPSQFSNKTLKSGKRPAKMSAKLPPAKKKKKIITPTSQDLSVADRLVYLTGIPKDASEQEVTDLVGSFGKINNVILMSCSEEESEKGEGQKASVCMVRAEDAQALANSTNLSIRDQQITTSVAKKPEAGESSDGNSSKPAPGQDKGSGGDDSGGETDQKTSDEKSLVLITGLPESGWSESDIIKLVQPFGNPSDIIQAAQIGKVLVSVPDMEIAQEIVKVHAFIPAKIQASELKMIHVKQHVGLSTPVALYNLLMGSVDPLESAVPISWNSLLVIRNVPNTPSGSSEVQKLVRRFGTVIKTLVLNNMVICEMATAAMALSVYKRFQTFPCIIQNNPLFFSRKPDPKASPQTKVISAYLDSSEETPANGKGSQAAADEEEMAQKETSESQLDAIEKDGDGTDEKMEIEKDGDGKDEKMEIEKDGDGKDKKMEIEKDGDGKDEKLKSTEKTDGDEKALGENRSTDDDIKEDSITLALSEKNAQPEADVETNIRETSADETVMETAEENKILNASTAGNDETPAGEEAKSSSADSKASFQETAMPQFPKVTQEMVNALLVECRTRTASNLNNAAASTNGEQGETQMETEPAEKTAEETKEQAKNPAEEQLKREERVRKEREARKEKEMRERERKERERRAWEKEERARRDERARRKREEERRERERRDRNRGYGESLSGRRSSSRSEGYRQSSYRDEQYYNSEKETKMMEEEEECEDFPFNLSDFVTVDEVGDVADLPSSPPPAVLTETTEGGDDDPTSAQQDILGDTSIEVTSETTSDAPAAPVESDEHESESGPETVPTAETSDSTLITAASQVESSPSQTHVETCEPAVPETETTSEMEATLKDAPDSISEVESLPAPAVSASAAPADSSSNSLAKEEVTPESENDQKEGNAVNHSQAETEEMVLDKTEEQETTQDKETGAPAVETGKHEKSEDETNTEEESLKKKLKTDTPTSTDYPLPPFDPSSPVGMEFLVPKTGFFCKVCNRFFSGTKEAEINHCKTLKHYENLQKYLQTTNMANVTVKPDSI